MNNIYSIYHSDDELIKKELTDIISNIGISSLGGVDVLNICIYDNFNTYIETIYIIDINGRFPIFLVEPNLLKVRHVNDGTFGVNEITYQDPSVFFEKYMEEMEMIKYVGDVATSYGDYFNVFSLPNEEYYSEVVTWLDKYHINGFDYLSEIVLSDDDILQTLESFVNYKVEIFMKDVEKSKIQGKALDSLVENPFANEYFDSAEAEAQNQ
jgi:hypothetical protein